MVGEVIRAVGGLGRVCRLASFAALPAEPDSGRVAMAAIYLRHSVTALPIPIVVSTIPPNTSPTR